MNATSKPKQLNIRSDEAYHLAHRLAESQRKTTQQIVVEALRNYAKTSSEPDAADQMKMDAEFARIMETGQKTERRTPPGTASDHSDMYDENGLPV